jgi:hypothetical protein
MSRESVIAIAGAALAACLGLLLYTGGAFEPREPDISGALEWLSSSEGKPPRAPGSEIIATRPLAMEQCIESLKAFTEEYPDLEAVWDRRPEQQSVAFPDAGDEGATIKVVCSSVKRTLTISQHWE